MYVVAYADLNQWEVIYSQYLSPSNYSYFFLRSLKYRCVLFQTSTLYSGEKHYTMGSLSTPLDIVCIILELKKKMRILEHIGLRGHITDYGMSLYKVCSN